MTPSPFVFFTFVQPEDPTNASSRVAGATMGARATAAKAAAHKRSRKFDCISFTVRD
jgi:hypothetical protein